MKRRAKLVVALLCLLALAWTGVSGGLRQVDQTTWVRIGARDLS